MRMQGLLGLVVYGGVVPMMTFRSSHDCRWNSSSVDASTARSMAVRLNGRGSSEPLCDPTILQWAEVRVAMYRNGLVRS